MTKRLKLIFEKFNIDNVTQLSQKTEGELMRQLPINIKLLREIVDLLAEQNLQLKGEPVFSRKQVPEENNNGQQ
jgi:chorismate-pyruvate lyase